MDDMNKYLSQFLEETTKKVDEEIAAEQIRSVGKPAYAMYKGFIDGGFTKAQAFDLTKTLLLAIISGVVKK